MCVCCALLSRALFSSRDTLYRTNQVAKSHWHASCSVHRIMQNIHETSDTITWHYDSQVAQMTAELSEGSPARQAFPVARLSDARTRAARTGAIPNCHPPADRSSAVCAMQWTAG